MFKCEHRENYLLKSVEISLEEKGNQTSSRVWIENPEGNSMDILPFFVVPGEVSIGKEDKEQLLTYESYTGKTIKFFSPEGTEKQTSGKILEKLNLLLRDKQKETPFSPEAFTKDEFLKRIQEESKLLLDTLISEKKIIPGIYQNREEIEIKLREWIGARASILFIAAEAGSGKTNLIVEMQRQYTERQMPSLLIRAGRMEKQSLKEQIAYLLNIDLQQGLAKYASIAGIQAEPTFILIDGLNEANNAEEIWHEIIDLSKLFEPGSLKFVVTNRANTKSELSRYSVSENDHYILYGENDENDTELGAYSFWLTALNMKEMKGAWESYALKDKTKFKPQFDFDAIAEFDRGLYNQISNPLILRLFLEIYNGKSLPKKGVKHLNVWQDWLKTFSDEEQTFLKLVAYEVWQKGENELLLDDLLQHETLKPYFTSDIINSPYNRLKNAGWISRYVKDLSGYIGFTVEGSLLYLLALQLQEQKPKIELPTIKLLMNKGIKLKKSAVESFLCEQALNGDLNLVAELIDSGSEDIDIAINSMLYYLKIFGVKATINKILENPTENDWKALFKLDLRLYHLELHSTRKELLLELFNRYDHTQKESLWLALKGISIYEKDLAISFLKKLDLKTDIIQDDSDLLNELGNIEINLRNYDNAILLKEKALHILKNKFGEIHSSVSDIYASLDWLWFLKKDFDKALEFAKKSYEMRLKSSEKNDVKLSDSLNNIGLYLYKKGNYTESLKYLNKSLDIRLIKLGGMHQKVATSFNNIALNLTEVKDYLGALDYLERSLHILHNTFGRNHEHTAICYTNIGHFWKREGNLTKALENMMNALEIFTDVMGKDDIDTAETYENIASILASLGRFDESLLNYKLSIEIQKKITSDEDLTIAQTNKFIGHVYFQKRMYNESREYFIKSLNIQLKKIGDCNVEVASNFRNIGKTFEETQDFANAIHYYKKSLQIKQSLVSIKSSDFVYDYLDLGDCFHNSNLFSEAIEMYNEGFSCQEKGIFPFKIAKCLENMKRHNLALDSYLKSVYLRVDSVGLEHESTQESILNVRRLANDLGKMEELPEWMKNIEL
jgi:Tfp pilus assembly protein PilF